MFMESSKIFQIIRLRNYSEKRIDQQTRQSYPRSSHPFVLEIETDFEQLFSLHVYQ